MLTMPRAPSRRAGFTLIELVIAMVLMSLVGAPLSSCCSSSSASTIAPAS